MYTQSQSSDPSIFSAIHVSGEGLPSSGLSDHFDRGTDRVSTELQQQEKRFKLTGYVCFFYMIVEVDKVEMKLRFANLRRVGVLGRVTNDIQLTRRNIQM